LPTETLGYHAELCTDCGSVNVSYNSCRNKYCPKCQHTVQEHWVEAQMAKLLPVGYFHLVFTIPQELNTLVLQNQTFLWKDYKDNGKSKVMKLDAAEFTRRFLLHVLPNKFVKIRHYGLLCSRNIRTKLSKCLRLTGSNPLTFTIKKYVKTCPACGSSKLIPYAIPKYSSLSP
jgi:Putative transposase.